MRRIFKKATLNWKYILGEITLIFIGISLAIWFNNWNEQMKLKRTEVSILKEIRSGLEADKVDLGTNLKGHEGGMRACDYVMEFYLGRRTEKLDSLNYYLLVMTLDATSLQNTAPYEYLKSRGISIIGDDSLRMRITNLYEYHYSELRTLEENFGPMQFYKNFAPQVRSFIKERIRYSEKTFIEPVPGVRPEEVDVEFMMLLRDLKIFRRLAATKYRQRLAEVDELIVEIDSYLGLD